MWLPPVVSHLPPPFTLYHYSLATASCGKLFLANCSDLIRETCVAAIYCCCCDLAGSGDAEQLRLRCLFPSPCVSTRIPPQTAAIVFTVRTEPRLRRLADGQTDGCLYNCMLQNNASELTVSEKQGGQEWGEQHRKKKNNNQPTVLQEAILHYISVVGWGWTPVGFGLRSWAERGIRAFSHVQTRERNEPSGLCVI